MNNNLQMLKRKLDNMVADMPLSSQEALILSRKIDNLIVEYYRKQNGKQ